MLEEIAGCAGGRGVVRAGQMKTDATASLRSSAAGSEPRAAALVTDARGVVTAWSEDAQTLLGYAGREVVNRPLSRLIHGVPPDLFAQHERGEWSGAVATRAHDGRVAELRMHARALVTGSGSRQWVLTFNAPETFPEGAEDGAPGDPALKQWAIEQLPLPMALFDRQGLCLAVNTEMTRGMAKGEQELIGLRIGYLAADEKIEGLEGIDEALDRVWRTGEVVLYEAYFRLPGDSRAHGWLAMFYPVRDATGTVRAVSLAGMDVTEQFRARRHLAVLNAAGMRIGTTLDVNRTADELAEIGTEQFADLVLVDLLDNIEDYQRSQWRQTRDRLLFRRAAQRSVLPGCPEAVVPIGAVHGYHDDSPPGRALASGRASRHVIDETTITAWAAGSPERARSIRDHGIHSLIAAPLQARGITLGLALFCRHRTQEPFDDSDLRLAEELADRAAVYIDNARQYTRERDIALGLQRSILPQGDARQSAVEVAWRYLPADPSIGIGGDWFDVIPLSGARVALVVGDVVGHGIGASATMGRLCTAVRTLADMEVAPDELLTQLDDLVLRLDRDGTTSDFTPGGRGAGEVGATCLYAVYDPVSRRCSAARAGHPVPVLASPGEEAKFLDIPAGPPLGVGGLPFEITEFDVPEGSVLAFYTDGLVESAHAGNEDGTAALCELIDPRKSLGDLCDQALHTLLPDLRTDDAALLLARTRELGPDRVATWDLPSELESASRARELATHQLAEWGLQEAEFVAELVVSELVTNAIRYGHAPVRLRLIRDVNLIFEVSDASSTAPHLRRARTFDEGGRGLFIVAQLTQRWGTRHTRNGKTIWAELAIDDMSG
ncbi:SpoIIE family protein phosphatase [Streptomyces sp. NPDC055815]